MRLLFVSGLSFSSDQIRRRLSQVHDVTTMESHSGTAAEVIAAIAHSTPDLLLIDRDLTAADGIAVAHEILRARTEPAPPVIVLAGVRRAGDVARAARAGVRGYLIGNQETWILNVAVRAVVSGEAWLSPAAAGELLDEFRRVAPRPSAALEHVRLSERERDVIRLVAHGHSNIEVARELGVSESTIKAHVSRMLAKLHLRRRAQLAVVARDLDII